MKINKNSTAKPLPTIDNLFRIIDNNEIDYIREITTKNHEIRTYIGKIKQNLRNKIHAKINKSIK